MKLKSIKIMIAGILLPMIALSMGFISPTSTFAAEGLKEGYVTAKPADTPENLFKGTNAVLPNIINTALFVIGGIAVLMLIYGGIRYTISGGDEKAITSAKNTILYAVIGIIVAVVAYAIVNFVINALV